MNSAILVEKVIFFLVCKVSIFHGNYRYCTLNHKTLLLMKKYVCNICGYVYDPEVGDPDSGVAPGTAFEDIPADWVCPYCGVGKDEFSPAE